MFVSPISIILNFLPSSVIIDFRSLMYCFCGSSSLSCGSIFCISFNWRCHIEFVASSSSFSVGPYVAIIIVCCFLPFIFIPVHLPQPLLSTASSVSSVYLAIIGCIAIVIPAMFLFFAGACAHLIFCMLFVVPVHPSSILFSKNFNCVFFLMVYDCHDHCFACCHLFP